MFHSFQNIPNIERAILFYLQGAVPVTKFDREAPVSTVKGKMRPTGLVTVIQPLSWEGPCDLG